MLTLAQSGFIGWKVDMASGGVFPCGGPVLIPSVSWAGAGEGEGEEAAGQGGAACTVPPPAVYKAAA